MQIDVHHRVVDFIISEQAVPVASKPVYSLQDTNG